MRGFQIWNQNLNGTTFNLFLGPKTVENGLNARFSRFATDLNSDAIFGILSSLRIFLASICYNLRILIF